MSRRKSRFPRRKRLCTWELCRSTCNPHFNTLRTDSGWGGHRDMSRDSMTSARGAHSSNASPASAKENGHTAQPSANFPQPPADSRPDDTPLSSAGELAQTWVHFVKTFVLIFPIYALGYFELSFSWLLIGLVIFFWWRRNTGGKHSRLSRALAFFDQGEPGARQGLTTSDLPPWVRNAAACCTADTVGQWSGVFW